MTEEHKLPITVEPAVPQDEARPPEPALVTTLGEMAREFVFFTTALINIHGRFDRDPVREFNAHRPVDNEDARPFIIDATYRPFFQGLGVGLLCGEPVNWDRRLYGIIRPRWEECLQFIGAIAMYEAACYHYARVMTHALLIVDPTALSRAITKDLPTVVITVFGVATNRHTVYLAPALDPPRTYAYPVFKPADPQLVAEAEAVLGPPPDPQQLVDRISLQRQER